MTLAYVFNLHEFLMSNILSFNMAPPKSLS